METDAEFALDEEKVGGAHDIGGVNRVVVRLVVVGALDVAEKVEQRLLRSGRGGGGWEGTGQAGSMVSKGQGTCTQRLDSKSESERGGGWEGVQECG